MACTRFEYVKDFETSVTIQKNSWFVIRVDGRSFTEFCNRHDFIKPNDHRCIQLMNRSACEVMKQFADIQLAYGHSDEFSRKTNLWNRRHEKLLSNVVSIFTSAFMYYWKYCFPHDNDTFNSPKYPPSFDGRVVCYPTDRNMRDYLSWRQADCHINNQYNICFWKLVQIKGLSHTEAQKGTLTADKNELLYTEFGINYNELPAVDKKGSLFVRIPKKMAPLLLELKDYTGASSYEWLPNNVYLYHTDIISDTFWNRFSFLLTPKTDS